MSYILEALKKSERERRLGSVPDVSVQQEGPTTAVAVVPSRPWLLPALVVSAILVAVLLGYPYLRPGTSGPTAVQEEKLAPVAAAPEIPPPPSVPEPDKAAPRQTVVAPPPVVADPPAAESPVVAVVPETVSTAAVEEKVSDELPRQETPPAPVKTVPPPRWGSASPRLREAIEPPHLDVHVYSPNPDRRFVLIDAQRYREGEPVNEGMRLEEITPDGVVLSWQGENFFIGR